MKEAPFALLLSPAFLLDLGYRLLTPLAIQWFFEFLIATNTRVDAKVDFLESGTVTEPL
jgi:hypothetical protein